MNNQKHCQTIIIGAGPAGLFASANLRPGKTLILEKKEVPGRKLMISGTGQCNFTHAGPMADFINHYGENHHFLKTAFAGFTNKDSISFFSKRGIRSFADQNGKIFPVSLKAADILGALLAAVEETGAQLLSGTEVVDIASENGLFKVITAKGSYTSDFLIIATGGKSYPATGSTGDGYRFAEALGHTIVEPRPALSAIITDNYDLADFARNSFQDAEISLWRGPEKIKTLAGDLLLTHNGLSGPVILNNSRYFRKGDTLKINFCKISESEFEKKFTSQADRDGKSTVLSFLRSAEISRNIAVSVLQKSNLGPAKPMAEISKKSRSQVASLCSAYPFVIKQVEGFKTAMVTTGGVSLNDINPLTMESMKVRHLYFCGEVIDIDGDTGGYNIQAALSTARLAAADINKKAGT